MPDKPGFLTRVRVHVEALLQKHWRGTAGRRFRRTITVVSDYTHDKIRPAEKLDEAPDLAWKAVKGAALEKHARALKEYAEEENERIDAELKRQTISSKSRQEKATADKLESEARVAKIKELQERIKLFDELKRFGAIPIWDSDGNMRVIKAPAAFAWDELQQEILKGETLPQLSDSSTVESESGDVGSITEDEQKK